MKAEENLIGVFDESKVAVENDLFKTVYYDITDLLNATVDAKASSVLEYVIKAEVELGCLFDEEDDDLSIVKEWYKKATQNYALLGCYRTEDGLWVKNDSRKIKLTFMNGSSIVFSNSEWGSITLRYGVP